MRLTVLWFCLIAFAWPACAHAQSVEVIAVEYPPFTTATRADGGTVFAEIRQWLADQALDLTLVPVFVPPARAQVMVRSDAWCASLYPPPAEIGHFIQVSNRAIDVGFLRRKIPGPFLWTDLGHFKNRKIAVLRARTSGGLLAPIETAGAQFVDVETVQQGIKLLLAGRVDYAFADNTTLSGFPAGSTERQSLEFSETVLERFPVGLYVSANCRQHFPKVGEKKRGADEKGAAG
ncbi:hypothetical protein GCM10011316_16710 [Roseibium aquae]|uniref:Solute-binding protein family 3/N-terminal domain-containing protein n=1 Tax=Roseibium aquae TaxID=1323746 RepID=A0A916TH62_9HYPH|nr:transporter substrate-binding domain-containing protein [Roseibium aquae]GGB45329.1 hypothetical protein GCM10011316_16710 [Roseibium aquae]